MNKTKHLTISSICLALGLLLPFLTGQIREIGNQLLPMHIPVLICGFVCGWKYGLLVGFLTPLLRFLLFSMPQMPNAIGMAFELASYGGIVGFLYRAFEKNKFRVYISLLIAMIAGRIVWGIVSILIHSIGQTAFTWQLFIGGALLNAIPGIIIQLILIPILILTLERTGVIKHATR